MTTDPREELRLLVRRARMLVQAERDAGVMDLPGTPTPPAEAVAAPAPQTAAQPTGRVARPSRPDRDFRPPVRALDLPPDSLAAFGDLPDRIANCTRCGLCVTRTAVVFGEGSAASGIVFCGEAPGADEDRSGRPFVGAAGELLTAMIEKGMRMRREDVFILNTLKCRPPGNRTPSVEEIAACRPFLEEQLRVLRPRILVAMGNPACRALLGEVDGISKIRGRVFEGFGAKIVPTYHPSYLLREPDRKREAWEDLKLVMKLASGE